MDLVMSIFKELDAIRMTEFSQNSGRALSPNFPKICKNIPFAKSNPAMISDFLNCAIIHEYLPKIFRPLLRAHEKIISLKSRTNEISALETFA